LFSVIACERDFENVGVSLVDNNQFNTKDSIFEVKAYTKKVNRSRVDANNPATNFTDGLTQYLLGVYKDDNFGLIETSFVSQIGLPLLIDFGNEPIIDSVILDIPYYATNIGLQRAKNPDNTDENDSIDVPDFRLDSIIGNEEFQLKVYRLSTFLNTLDPLDPTKNKRYYSDEEYNTDFELYSGNFKPNRNDTIAYIKRRALGADIRPIDSITSIIKETKIPSIKIPLNEDFFTTNFLDQQDSGIFSSFENFVTYFKGILIETSGEKGSLMTLAMTNATINIYYTNEVLTTETDEADLNEDGDTDDMVNVRTPQTMTFPLQGVRASLYNRDRVGFPIENVTPNINEGDAKLFVQGAAGAIAEVEFQIDVDEIRAKNWLVNGAFLDVYVDDVDDENIPNQLYLYNVDNNSTILDVITEARVNGIGGILQRSENGKPLRYQFSITDYMSEILKSGSTIDIAKLAIKMYHPTDVPQGVNDTIIKDFSWNSQGVVLKGKKLDGETDYDKRIKLNIFYTEQ